jgi:hypothetical protein
MALGQDVWDARYRKVLAVWSDQQQAPLLFGHEEPATGRKPTDRGESNGPATCSEVSWGAPARTNSASSEGGIVRVLPGGQPSGESGTGDEATANCGVTRATTSKQ